MSIDQVVSELAHGADSVVTTAEVIDLTIKLAVVLHRISPPGITAGNQLAALYLMVGIIACHGETDAGARAKVNASVAELPWDDVRALRRLLETGSL